MESGKSPDEIAETLGVGRCSVFEWQKKYREGGLAALSTKFASGRPTILSDEQMVRLYGLIAGKDPRQYSFEFALWTRVLVAELIRVKFDVVMTPQGIGKLLRRLGLSPQRPLYRATQQDPEAVARWRAEEFPAIREQARREGAEIYFADEAGIRTDHHAGTTWAPIGQTPVVEATAERGGVNMISAVSQLGVLHFEVFTGRFDAGVFVEFLTKLTHDIDRPVFLILDNHSAHKAKLVRDYVASLEGRLKLFYLPAYSPELNPDEWVWKNIKHDQVGRSAVTRKSEFFELVTHALERLQQLPDVVRGFFRDPSLAYINT